MTPKQKKVLDFIAHYAERNGYQPTQQEIAQSCGFQSLGTVQHYLRLLERDGHLSRRWNAKRGVQITETLTTSATAELPLVGIVAAGKPVEAFDLPDVIEVPSSMASPGNVVYEVRGDSMVEMGIMDGDYVAVHPQPVAENGQTVIAEVNGSITIKKYLHRGDHIELHPANAAMSPIVVTADDDFRIRGVLVGSMRFYRKWSGKSST
ncbi:transcriptional repressor LexA [Geomesophilobacter sediminis]|uniref:Repressor LexA n=1 Tax=Geomesophilobacter sediminis TaxID=2798584 RepID=A0A8J7JDJ0_9BACT|nr:transcriptional repressor LexA [Geomesophilobacter sediminis]MBJ6725213.1 repressor LexA [Geomesophilobacter sediminis]